MGTLLRFRDPVRGQRVGVQIANIVYDVTDRVPSVRDWLRITIGRAQAAIDDLEAAARGTKLAYLASVLDAPPMPGLISYTAPVDAQDVWSAGVTTPNMRAAREQMSKVGGDTYTRAFDEARPMLMLRALSGQVAPPYGQVGMRRDSSDSVVEPELAVLLNPALEIVGYALCLGIMARDIGSENPLFLSQAYHYTSALSLGPGFVLSRQRSLPSLTLNLNVSRDRQVIYEGEFHTATIQRDVLSAIEYLGRSHAFPDGVVLLTGCGIVMPASVSLRVGDTIRASANGVGELTNAVMLV